MHPTAHNFNFIQTSLMSAICDTYMVVIALKLSGSDYVPHTGRQVGYTIETLLN